MIYTIYLKAIYQNYYNRFDKYEFYLVLGTNCCLTVTVKRQKAVKTVRLLRTTMKCVLC